MDLYYEYQKNDAEGRYPLVAKMNSKNEYNIMLTFALEAFKDNPDNVYEYSCLSWNEIEYHSVTFINDDSLDDSEIIMTN